VPLLPDGCSPIGHSKGVRDANELLTRADYRGPMDKHVDSLSGSSFERAVIGGEPFVVKYLGHERDWLARALGDRDCWTWTLWRTGLLDALPPVIDHAIVAMSRDPVTGEVTTVMRDVGDHLVPAGDGPVPVDQHLRFLDHMARVHAHFWGFADGADLMPAANRYTGLTPAMAEREAAAGHDDAVPRAIPGGWAALRAAAPEAHAAAAALAADPGPLVAALAATPATFVHGDWKFGNLGSQPDGRTILLDWGWPGRAAPLVDVAWYLAVNCDRLPVSKEDTLAAYRAALEAQGVATDPWWDAQLPPALLGAFVQLGWSKAGDPAELDWWVTRAIPAARKILG
jgi:hypothetical protein